MKDLFEWCYINENSIINKSKEDNIDYWTYRVFNDKKFNFYKWYNNKEIILDIINKNQFNYNDKYILKNILQNNYPFGKEKWIEYLDKQIDKYKNEIFKFLDNTSNPYYYIFVLCYQIQDRRYEKGYYPYQIESTGVNDVTLFISGEYVKYKLQK